MAILMKKANLLSDQQVQLLNGMEGRVDVYFTPLVPGAFPSEVVFVNNASRISASLDYEDLDFKFEYFFFQIRPFYGELGKKVESTEVKVVRCILRCEWKHKEQGGKVTFGRGKVEDVPDNAMACCSDVGLLMVSADGSRVLIYSDDNFPLSVGVTKEDDFINGYLNSCDVIGVDHVSEFSKNLVDKGFNVGYV
ncbi:hypothetical protein [Marinobacter nauticus]|uniref:Uncharacterized protein n=1 Tax=Marinobacter nauticus TaxID=2743 RepID=A0A368V5Y1_MARNT|nr:hypothetical protein [Marinobacter nauticus]RBP75699.1 hypothetical protein DET64_103301 [Marinobacter nauticus]RCW36508.1 hypothetical protein DET51_103301 [Marinobacter nauticus]